MASPFFPIVFFVFRCNVIHNPFTVKSNDIFSEFTNTTFSTEADSVQELTLQSNISCCVKTSVIYSHIQRDPFIFLEVNIAFRIDDHIHGGLTIKCAIGVNIKVDCGITVKVNFINDFVAIRWAYWYLKTYVSSRNL